MSQNKTVFQFQVNANMAVIETVIRNWLVANEYKFEPRPNANYYAYNDPWVKGKRGFEYYLNNNVVTIVAYLGTFENPTDLDGFVGAFPKQAYRDDLAPLLEEIKKLENGGQPTGQAAPVSTAAPMGQQGPLPTGNTVNTFVEQNNKRQETLVMIGFILSIVGVLISCLGVTYGAILIAFEFYCGCQGLKSGKKGLAIATIVLASINVLTLLLSIVLTVLMA